MAFKMAAKSPLMKQLTGAQEKLPAGLKSAIEAAPESPAKNMNKGYGSPAKNMNKGYGTPSPMKAEMALSIEDSNYKKEMKAAKSPAKEIDDRPRSNNRTKQKTVNLKSKKGSIPTPKGAQLQPVSKKNQSIPAPAPAPKRALEVPTGGKISKAFQERILAANVQPAAKSPAKMKAAKSPAKEIGPEKSYNKAKAKKANKTSTKTLISKEVRNPVGGLNVKPAPKTPKLTKSPAKKSKSKVEQDYARNAIADYKRGDKKAAGYEKKKALEVAAGEGK